MVKEGGRVFIHGHGVNDLQSVEIFIDHWDANKKNPNVHLNKRATSERCLII